jgi:HEAT repeat protein
MQMVFDLKTILIGTAVVVGGYYGYRHMFGELEGKDVGRLIQLYSQSQPARRMIIRRRAVSVYASGRDYDKVVRALQSRSPDEQALAVIILREKHEQRSIEKLMGLLNDSELSPVVQVELATTMADFGVMEAIPRLIELTDVKEEQSTRAAAHSALKELTGAGAEVKFGDATRQHWTHWWKSHGGDRRLRKSKKAG